MASVYVETWRDTYVGILPATYLGNLRVSEIRTSFEREIADGGHLARVAESGESGVVGFVTGGSRRRKGHIYEGEMFTLYVLPSFQRRGLGLRVAEALAKALNHIDIYTLKVSVLRANPWRPFYEKINGILLGTRQIRYAGTDLSVCTYGWLDTDLIGWRLARPGPHRKTGL
jgi:ribosomal protein S18 acetylase RimI-like enzyme